MNARALEGLRALAECLPPGTAVPVPREVLLALLAGEGLSEPEPRAERADYTVAELAQRFGRHASTIRLWIEQGRFPGAYHFRKREWRVPPAGLQAFETAERENNGENSGESVGHSDRPASANGSVNLSDWRRAS